MLCVCVCVCEREREREREREGQEANISNFCTTYQNFTKFSIVGQKKNLTILRVPQSIVNKNVMFYKYNMLSHKIKYLFVNCFGILRNISFKEHLAECGHNRLLKKVRGYAVENAINLHIYEYISTCWFYFS
jgi:hypothetical protein